MVGSEPTPLGNYAVTIHVGDDRSWTLTHEQAVAYGAAVIARAMEAAHAEASYRLLTSFEGELSPDLARDFIMLDVWQNMAAQYDGPDDFHRPTRPLEFTPSLATERRTGDVSGVVQISLDGNVVGHYAPTDARRHGLAVLEAAAAARCDTATYAGLNMADGVTEQARGFIDALSEHFPAGWND